MSKLQKFLCLFLLSASLAISGTAWKQSNNQQTPPTITVGYSNNSPAWWPWAIAESEGLFAKRGLDVELKWYENYSDSVVDMVSGKLDANSQKFSDTGFFKSSAIKGEVGILLNSNSARREKLIVSQSIIEAKDLRGKTVAVDFEYSDNELLTNFLKDADLTIEDINLIKAESGAASSLFSLKHNSIDAVVSAIPYWKIALKRNGSKVIASSQDYPDKDSDLLVATEDLVNNFPKKVQSIADTWFDVLDFMDIHPEKADRIIARRAGISQAELSQLNLKSHLAARADNKKMEFIYASKHKF